MKKQKTLAVLLSAAMVAGAIPTAALAEVAESNSESGVKAAELNVDQKIEEQNEDSENEESGFVLMNVPYDKVYENDIVNDTKVDAVSSATKEKTRKKKVVNGTYHSEDGSEIKGAIIPVWVDDLSLLKKFKKVTASNAEKVEVASASDSTYNDNLFNLGGDYAYAVLPEGYTPKVYKTLSKNEKGELVFSEFKGGEHEIDTAPTIVACSGRYHPGKNKPYHGDYEIQIDRDQYQKLIASSSDAVYEVVLETNKGDSYGLRLLENTYLKDGELAFSTGFTTKSKKCILNPNHYKSLIGKTITQIRFVTEKGIFVIPTELKVEEQEIYALMNIPYDELYKNDLKQNDIPVDAMTSATYQKTRTKSLSNGSYHKNSDGSKIDGVTFPVKLMVNSDADLKDLTHVGDGSKELTITTTLRGKQQTNTYKGRDTLFENGTYAYYVLNPEEKPDFYKEVTVGEDGNFKFSETKFQNGKSVKKSDAAAEITTKTTRGDYQINVSGLDKSVTNSSIYEVILETKDGKSYGLRHLENIWRGNELGIYTGYTKESHGVDASVEPYKDIMGKTIDKITYLTSAGAYEIDTDLYVPMKDGTQAEVADGKSGNGSVAVTVKLPEGFDPEYQITGLKTSFADGALTYTDAMPGKYTLTISDKNEKWADIEADFVLSSDTNPAYYNRNYSVPAVIKKGSADEADFANYLKNITKVSVNGKEYAASGRGAVVIVKKDGTIDLANSSVFDGKEPYTVVVTSTGYPDLTFEIKQVTYDSSDSDSGESGEPAGSSSKKKNTSASDGMTAGSWSQDAAGNWYFKNAANGKNLVSAWAHIENPYAGAGQPKDSWFHFDANGVMQTGWFKDSDGRWYFFNPVSDSTLGRMTTGWNWIKGNDGKLRCYYFEETSNGHRGAMYSGTTTPDGYTVDADGAWTVNGIVVTR